MRNGIKILLLMFGMLLCLIAPAQLSLPKIIGNDMVLQRNQLVPVWGYAKPGGKIMVEFAKQQKTAVANDAGEWKVTLDAMPAASVPQRMIIKSVNQSIVLNNILVGEVWICSGQSNMEYSMRKNSKVTVPEGAAWPVNELETAHNKNIRIFLVERKKMKPDSAHAGWSVAEDSALRAFSAAGYFFAKKLNAELNVPIGVISSAIPGSRIEPWMPKEAFTALPFFNDQSDTTHKIDGEPGKFYETMIVPLAPFAVKGFLWYQGESNCFLNERLQYAYKMEALINWWRKIWNDNQLPFYYVQIAPFAYSKAGGKISYTQESLPEFWEAQQLVLKIPQTAMIATTDLNFDLDNLHPHFKWEIGKRLALAALANVYNKKDFIAMGPVYKSMKANGNKIDIGFSFTGKGLVSNDNKELTGFAIAGADGIYVPAKASIKNNMVEVWADNVTQPVSVRFSWNEGTHANLYNKDGLPALPFRTDNKLVALFK